MISFQHRLQLADCSHHWVGAGIFGMRLSKHERKNQNTKENSKEKKEVMAIKRILQNKRKNKPTKQAQRYKSQLKNLDKCRASCKKLSVMNFGANRTRQMHKLYQVFHNTSIFHAA